MKGIIHLHSSFSHDAINKIDKIIDKALENDLDFIILTDHDTINGSLALRKRIKERKLNLIAPIAAEYKTSYGDIIAAFINNEITDLRYQNFILEVKKQNGLILFPHPFQSHPNDKIELIASDADLIEISNSRCTKIQDKKSESLSYKFIKLSYHGSDAHLPNELCNVIVEIEGNLTENDLKNSLIKFEMGLLKTEKTFIRNISFSQIIKSIKQKNRRLFLKNLVGIFIDTIRLGWNKRVT